MILAGQYDAPFVRRVAISLSVVGFTYEDDTRPAISACGAATGALSLQ
jgi:hypothetical protein